MCTTITELGALKTKICSRHCSLKDGNGLSDRNFRPSPSPPRKNVCHLGCGVAAGWSLYPAVGAPVIQNSATRWCVRRCPSQAEKRRRGSRSYLSSDKIPRTIESSLNGHHRNTPNNPQLPRRLYNCVPARYYNAEKCKYLVNSTTVETIRVTFLLLVWL